MIQLDTRRLVDRLKTIESLALIPRVASTNLIGRRIVAECIENELSLPNAMIIAGEQFAGIGRNARSWSSPPGKGIYATTLHSRPASELSLVPLWIANIVATYLRDVFAIDARIKWPNDILVGGRKIAGILIEARIQDDRAYLLIGTGINVEPVEDENRPNAVAIREVSKRNFDGLSAATEAFIEHLDDRLSRPFDRHAVLEEWRSLTVHQPGDPITCVIGDRTVGGRWIGIDEQGRAMLREGKEVVTISAGDLVMT
jgi:BirA family transcriptional regulator, biotin operon repressor / biotin---[acetyl-CoA-carboxylase] ligase